MSRVLITGSTEGLRLMAARLLADDGHSVTLHARSAARAQDARAALPAARAVVIGDLSSIAGMRQVAEQANADGPYDAVIHNAGVGYREPQHIRTDDGLEHVFAINAPVPFTPDSGRPGLGYRWIFAFRGSRCSHHQLGGYSYLRLALVCCLFGHRPSVVCLVTGWSGRRPPARDRLMEFLGTLGRAQLDHGRDLAQPGYPRSTGRRRGPRPCCPSG
jgi:NAD(P)-dependent dehydrogenase (short-subunit alcohol dehydrogenase family)